MRSQCRFDRVHRKWASATKMSMVTGSHVKPTGGTPVQRGAALSAREPYQRHTELPGFEWRRTGGTPVQLGTAAAEPAAPRTDTERHVRGRGLQGRADDRMAVARRRGAATVGRAETMLERQFYRAMNQLERLQRARRGEVVPPPLTMEVSGG